MKASIRTQNIWAGVESMTIKWFLSKIVSLFWGKKEKITRYSTNGHPKYMKNVGTRTKCQESDKLSGVRRRTKGLGSIWIKL